MPYVHSRTNYRKFELNCGVFACSTVYMSAGRNSSAPIVWLRRRQDMERGQYAQRHMLPAAMGCQRTLPTTLPQAWSKLRDSNS